MAAVAIVGSYLSPYVRKVLVCLEMKGVEYEIDPIVPFYGNDDFGRLSPLRRVPLLLSDDFAVSDSTVICEYIEETFGYPSLLPADAADRARSRWLEEYADSRLGEVMIWHLFNQVVIKRFVWHEPPDEAVLERAREQEIPEVLDYLEAQVPAAGFLFGAIGIADIAIASFFRNATLAGYNVDAARWPRAAAFVTRVLELPAFQTLLPFEQITLKTPPAELRGALATAGARLAPTSFGSPAPRRGVMSID